MLSLIETIIGFAAIMLMLSLLVKSLTSLIKNTWDYYCSNLEHEVKRLVLETLGQNWASFLTDPNVKTRAPWLEDIKWERLGDEYLTTANMRWLLKQFDPNRYIPDLEERVNMHLSNLRYAFEMRMKNLALATGLALCLLLNINAFAIWKSLYTDEQLRATFANSYANQAVKLAAKEEEAKTKAKKENPTVAPPANSKPAAQTPQHSADAKKSLKGANKHPGKQGEGRPANLTVSSGTEKQDLDKEAKDFKARMITFLSDVSFGVGRIWQECLSANEQEWQKCQDKRRQGIAARKQAGRERRFKARMAEAGKIDNVKAKGAAEEAAKKAEVAEEKADQEEAEAKQTLQEESQKNPRWILLYEFFGSLLTGILISIGAPYWHDLLQALSALRPDKAKTNLRL